MRRPHVSARACHVGMRYVGVQCNVPHRGRLASAQKCASGRTSVAHSKQIKEIEHKNMVMRASCKCSRECGFDCARAYHPHNGETTRSLSTDTRRPAGKPRVERPTGGASVHYGESEDPRKMESPRLDLASRACVPATMAACKMMTSRSLSPIT